MMSLPSRVPRLMPRMASIVLAAAIALPPAPLRCGGGQ
jgi:hypothetical protein